MTNRLAGLLAAAVMLGTGATASAAVFNYAGLFTQCIGTCDSFAALGGPGGATNPVPSEVTGTIEINVAPGGAFTSADIVGFSFTVFNPGAVTEDPVFDAAGNLLNPTTTNPLPLGEMVATVNGSGTLAADGSFDSGTVQFVFTASPFSDNQGEITFDVVTGLGVLTILNGFIEVAEIQGDFTLVPLPGAVWMLLSALAGGLALGRRRA